MHPASGPVVVETTGAVATITLNRPDRLNAVSLPPYDELTDALDAIETDATVRAVILTGAGRAFCAGADLKEHGAGDTADSRGAYVEVVGGSCFEPCQLFPIPPRNLGD